MDAFHSLRVLDDADAARAWLAGLGFRDPDRGVDDLRRLARREGPGSREVLGALVAAVDGLLARCADPDMALSNLERYVGALDDPLPGLARLAERPRTTDALLQVFSTSQYLSELLIRRPELIDWLQSGAERRDRPALVGDLWNLLNTGDRGEDPRLALRRFRNRETLRIGYNDIVRDLPLEITTADLSNLAEACIEAAVRLARATVEARHGRPTRADGEPARFVVLAMGKLGGGELNYSSDVDLIFLYDEDGATDGPRPATSAEFFERMGAEIVRLLADHTPMGVAYRVDLRLRPDGDDGPLARSLDAALGYYVTRGRTWERQALIKCRPIAGDLDLGRGFVEAVAPFVHRRYLSSSEIAEIKALKRRIERRTDSAGRAEVEVKTGRGGIRDVEFVVQFLQLLHGGAFPEVREANTLKAVDRLERVGSLTAEERAVMDDAYRFLRRVEHRLQILFDRQTHEMPRDAEALRTLAVRMGYPPLGGADPRSGPADRFLADYQSKTRLNRRILDHVLHDAFPDGGGADPMVDLVLAPDPTEAMIAEAFSPLPFRDRRAAYDNLEALGREDSPFLSQPRCRHFLASIAPQLMRAVGRTADPDATLANLERVSASLGAKAMLWELFTINPPSLQLYVEICASSAMLSRLLITNPGMIDELMDSLVVDQPPPAAAIRAELAELTRGAEDLAPILLSFRNKEWLRIGTLDVLGRAPVRQAARELADVAEAVVGQAARDQWDRRADRFGVPTRPSDGGPDRWAILGLGRLGGRELNYHSDLDLVFLHESDGRTTGGAESIPNQQFIAEVAQRLIRALNHDARVGTLYQIDARLRPHGAAGPLVNTLDAFQRYYAAAAQPWERLALTRGRVVFATDGFDQTAADALRSILTTPVDRARLGVEVAAARRRLEESRGSRDLKRGVGGLADVEFVVQYLMLMHAEADPDVIQPNLWDGLDALLNAGALDRETHAQLRDAYNFVRGVEARLRLIHDRAGTELPADPDDLARLARRLSDDGIDPTDAASSFLLDSARHANRARAVFQRFIPLE